MLFNSLDFAIFLPVVFFIYWFVVRKNLKVQNLFIAVASYVFYGWWDWRFLSLILFSTVIDFLIGLALEGCSLQKKRKLLLLASITVNIGLLCFFKYYNFFVDSFVDAFQFFGYSIKANSLKIILPVGISFYTFQTLSYTIDVYKRKMKPTSSFVSFAAFVSFFPQLVAGPIERAQNLLPQFYTQRKFQYYEAIVGLRQILWGLFKKIVIADNCAYIADQVFNHSDQYRGIVLVLGAFFFTFQIYGDFSGYSDIAIGTARLFGFKLMKNFAFPYFSRDIAEFWRRWHISLSTWFRDYVYFPLGGSRGSHWMIIRNTFIIFLVSGFWHGPNWTFIIWGGLNALYFLPLILLKKNRAHIKIVAKGRYFPTPRDLVLMMVTFIFTMFAWIFFRAESIHHAIGYIAGIFTNDLFITPPLSRLEGATTTLALIGVFMVVEWIGREQDFALEKIKGVSSVYIRYFIYILIVFSIIWYGGQEQEFIYFQF